MPKKFDREPIAWITRGGKHVPIFEGDDKEGKEYTVYRYGDEEGDAIFYSKNKDYVEEYARLKGGRMSDIKETKIMVKNPLVVDLKPNEFSSPLAEKKYIDKGIRDGNDFVIFRDKENDDEFYVKLKKK